MREGRATLKAGWLALAAVAALAVGCSTRGKPAVAAASRDISTRYNMARIYLEQGRPQDSIRLLKQVLDQVPRHDGARNLLGLVHWSTGRLEQARAEFERALEINPYLSDARVNLGVVLSEQGDYTRADAEFRRTLEDKTYPTPEKPLVNLALNQMKQGKPREALARAGEAIRTNPRHVRAYEVYVQALRTAGAAGAGTEYQTLQRDMDRSLDFHLNLAEAFVREKDNARARAHLQRVVALEPDSEQATRARQSLEKIH